MPMDNTKNKKRKYDTNDLLMPRKLAQKLHVYADVHDVFLATQWALQTQFARYKKQKGQADERRQLLVAMEQLTHFQTFFCLEMETQMLENVQLGKLKFELDQLLQKSANPTKSVTSRTQKIVQELPRLMKVASGLVLNRRYRCMEHQNLPTKHQWIPLILWSIYDRIETERSGPIDDITAMKRAMYDVMKTLRETNPFFYLQVLYQAPPADDVTDNRWQLKTSEKLLAISETMTPYFQNLERRSLALLKQKDSMERKVHGWKQLRETLVFVKRAARHFHYLILQLYAMAMKRDQSHVHAGVISEKAARGILSDDAKVRSRLRLCRANANANDKLVKESYEWTPELLVYLEEWRQYRGKRRIHTFGFHPKEQVHDFLPQFLGDDQPRRGKRSPRRDVLADIGRELHHVNRTWRRSKLGTRQFRSMNIDDIGILEKKIKHSFAQLVNLVYKMMLARWMDRRNWPAEWWASLWLREKNHDGRKHEPPVDVLDTVINDHESNFQINGTQPILSRVVKLGDNQQDITEKESVEDKNTRRSSVQLPAATGFRRPSTMTLVSHASRSRKKAPGLSPSPDVVQAKPLLFAQPIRDHDVYAWTNKDVRAFTHNAKRIDKVRAAMMGLCDQFNWWKVSRETTSGIDTETRLAFGDNTCDDAWRAVGIASHLCTLTAKAASFAEEVAIYEAASELTVKRVLLATEANAATVADNGDTPALHVSSDDSTSNDVQESA